MQTFNFITPVEVTVWIKTQNILEHNQQSENQKKIVTKILLKQKSRTK